MQISEMVLTLFLNIMKSTVIVGLLSFFLFVSCSKESENETAYQETMFWEQSHSTRLGLQGKVKGIVEYNEQEDERFILSEMHLDEEGNVTYFHPVNKLASDLPQTYWQPTASQSFDYTYSGGRLMGVRVTHQGELPVEYTFTYGGHKRYIPLLFLDLKPLSHLFLQGVTGMEASDHSLSFRLTEDQVIIVHYSREITTTYTYMYESELLPKSSLEVIALNGTDGEALEQHQSVYSYYPHGAIQKVDVETHTGSERSQMTSEYDPKGNILKQEQITPLGLTRWVYGYNSIQLLTQIDRTDENANMIGKMKAVFTLDTLRNWTCLKQDVQGVIDWELREGKHIRYREITY